MQDTYKIILDSYAKRLISTNSRSRTIYYSKNNKYIMDISKFMSNLNSEKITEFFSVGQTKVELELSCTISPTSKVFAMFDSYLNNEISREDILEEYNQFVEADFRMLENEKTNCYYELYNKYEALKKKQKRQIYKIKEENDAIIKQMGKDDLYIGYPYIQGRFNKDKVVRAPLLLHKISVQEKGDRIIIKNEGTKLLNPVFIMSFLVENDITYNDTLDFEILESDYMFVVDKILSNIGIKYENKINKNSFELKRMKSLTKQEFKKEYKYEDNKFEILSYITLGIFPLSDKKIYDDVKALKESDSINQMLNTFYDKTSEVKVFHERVEDVDESKLKYITDLDYSQKKTLQEALEKNCVIQGPPGTGKSQVIANIAANLLLNRKNVLFCSEKRTATDVIFNRLGKLNAFSLLLHDHVSEKNYFYDSIVKAIETAKENVDKYKKKTFSFNQDYKIKAFFDNAKKYNEIMNGDYKGHTISEIINNVGVDVICEDEIELLATLVKDKTELENLLYKYEASVEYQNGLKWKKELDKDYYLRNDLNIKNKKIFGLNILYKEVSNCNNRYFINQKISSFMQGKAFKISKLKKFFYRNEKLNDRAADFLMVIFMIFLFLKKKHLIMK